MDISGKILPSRVRPGWNFTIPVAIFLAASTIVPAASAQDPAQLSRNVKGENAAADKSVTLNQVDTSLYPDVKLFVSVSVNGVPVTDLTANDFSVREDEVLQNPLNVAPKLEPLSLVLTLDTSGSMKEALPVVQASAAEFVQNLLPGDEALGIQFSRSVKKLTEFSKDKGILQSAIKSTTARGDTALYDALYASVEALKGRPGRKAVVLLSDGVDDAGDGTQLSMHSFKDVLSLAKQVNVPIFTIGLGTAIDEKVLAEAALQTGATFSKAPDSSQLKALYAGISAQLSGQYSISYRSNLPADGSSRRVQISQGDTRVSSKEYIAPSVGGVVVTPIVPPTATVEVKVQAPSTIVLDSGPRLIKGGATLTDAVLLEPGVLYKSDSGKEAPWYKVVMKPGQYASVWAQSLGGFFDYLTLHNAQREKLDYGTLSPWQIITMVGSAASDYKGDVYLSVPGTNCAFSIGVLDGFDSAVNQSDVGSDESTAVGLKLDTTVTGYLQRYWDGVDSYILDLPAGKYLVKVRPSEKLSIRISLKDLEEGRDLFSVTSPNAGALTRFPFTLSQAGRVKMDISAENSGLGRYSAIVGNPEVQSPTQPPPPVIVQRDTLRN